MSCNTPSSVTKLRLESWRPTCRSAFGVRRPRTIAFNRREVQPVWEHVMSEKKPVPIFAEGNIKFCPVCRKRSYSRDGVHPQCAVIQADASRTEQLQAERKKQSPKKNNSTQRTWAQKTCPKCNVQLHARRKVCDCGFNFGEARMPI